jgi:hypothetical protein
MLTVPLKAVSSSGSERDPWTHMACIRISRARGEKLSWEAPACETL